MSAQLTTLSYSSWAYPNDPDGNAVACQWDWGDGDTSAWTDFRRGPNYHLLSPPHQYVLAGSYSVRVQAKDTWDLLSGWSQPKTVVANDPDFPWYDSRRFDLPIAAMSIVMHPSGDRYFVAGRDAAAAMSPTGDTALAIVTIPYMGYEDGCPLGMSPDGAYLYVTGYFYPWLWRIRSSDMIVTDSVQIGQLTHGIAVSPDGQHVYVVNAFGSLQVLRTTDLTVEHTTQLGSELSCITVNPSGQYVYVGCYDSQALYIVRTSDYAVESTLPIATRGMCVRPDGAYLYVGCDNEATIAVVRTSDNSIAARVALPGDAHRFAVTPDGQYVYFTGDGYGLDGSGILRTADNLVRGYISIGWYSVTFAPDGQTAYGVGGTAFVLTR